MHLQLLLLLTIIALAKCTSEPTTPEKCLSDHLFRHLEGSLKVWSLCNVLPRTPQPSSRQLLRKPEEVWYNEKGDDRYHWTRTINETYEANTTCNTSLPVSVQLTADNGTITCSIQGGDLEKCQYSVEFYYEDKRIFKYLIRPDRKSEVLAGSARNFETRVGNDQYPNFSMVLDLLTTRNSDPKSEKIRGLKSWTLNGVYQCSIELSNRQRFDSNAIYYHWNKNASPVISSKTVDRSMIGKQLRCALNNFSDNECPGRSLFDQIRPVLDMIPRMMKVTEVKHLWKPDSKQKVVYSLKYHQTGNETIYQAECRINGDLRVNVENPLYDFYTEQVCFGINDRYVGCYQQMSNWNHSIWNTAEKDGIEYRILYGIDWVDPRSSILSDVMIKKIDRIEHGNDTGDEQVFKVLLKNLSSEHRRFWCVKTFIFGTLLSEHSFESNYLSKPEAELLQSPVDEKPFGEGGWEKHFE